MWQFRLHVNFFFYRSTQAGSYESILLGERTWRYDYVGHICGVDEIKVLFSLELDLARGHNFIK